MRRLWDDPQLAAEMGKRAEQRYWDLFTAERMAASYADLYRKLLAKKDYELAPLFRNAEGGETMTVPRLSISIVSHRHGELVHDLLADLNAIGLESAEVILTLNVPGEKNVVPQGFSLPLVVVENPVPRGFGANHNAAFALSKGEYFCVLNPDIRIAANPFPTLIEHLAKRRAGVVAPEVRNSSGKIEDNARPFPALSNPLVKALFLPWRGAGATSPGPYPDWVAGMFMLFPREAFSSVGGFDEWYFLYYEDVDLCARLRVAGWEVALCESVGVVHDARHDSHKHLRYFYWHVRSMARYFLTWPRLALGLRVSSRNS
jgi:GT2 family glycosyltransferase